VYTVLTLFAIVYVIVFLQGFVDPLDKAATSL